MPTLDLLSMASVLYLALLPMSYVVTQAHCGERAPVWAVAAIACVWPALAAVLPGIAIAWLISLPLNT